MAISLRRGRQRESFAVPSPARRPGSHRTGLKCSHHLHLPRASCTWTCSHFTFLRAGSSSRAQHAVPTLRRAIPIAKGTHVRLKKGAGWKKEKGI